MVRVLQHCPARLKENNKLNDDIDHDVQGKEGNCEDKMAKKDICLSEELRRSGITQWHLSGCGMYVGEAKENASKLSATKLGNELYENRESSTTESDLTLCMNKKRCISIEKLEEAKAVSSGDQVQNDHIIRGKCKKLERWSQERYNTAQQIMLEILKEEGAVYGKAISRQDFRAVARKRIGDTGLLDHLLKNVDGKLAPGGRQRCRRCYNSNGVMEYWLESADLDEIRRIAGVRDPYWIPPSEGNSGDAILPETVSVEELRQLKENMDNFKCDVLRIVTKDIETVKVTLKEEMRKELVKWDCKIKQRLSEIKSSISHFQDMSRNIESWKFKVEQQLMELSSAVSTLQAKCSTLCPDKWDDFLGGTNPNNIQGQDLATWWESSGLLNAEEETMLATKLQLPEPFKTENIHPVDPVFNEELNVLKDEMANVKREMIKLIPRKQDDNQSNRTVDSVVAAKSKLDADNTFVMFKEMCTAMAKWKPKVEKQLFDLAKTVAGLADSKEFPQFKFPPESEIQE